MKKVLIGTNVLTLCILTFTIIKTYQFRHQLISVTQEQASQPCQYQLKYFDFHYKKETDSPNIVMLGNSLIQHANWDSLLNRKDVINRGIAGDKLHCICERLDYLKNISAKICFIEGGINDLPGQSADTLFYFYKQIVEFWQNKGTIPVISLVLYISPKAGEKFPYRKDFTAINTTVQELNSKLETFAMQNKIDFIDLNASLSDKYRLVLKDEYTTDGVHLTPAAYQIWTKQIKAILQTHNI